MEFKEFRAKSVEDALTKPVVKYRKRVWNKTGNGTYHHENGIED